MNEMVKVNKQFSQLQQEIETANDAVFDSQRHMEMKEAEMEHREAQLLEGKRRCLEVVMPENPPLTNFDVGGRIIKLEEFAELRRFVDGSSDTLPKTFEGPPLDHSLDAKKDVACLPGDMAKVLTAMTGVTFPLTWEYHNKKMFAVYDVDGNAVFLEAHLLDSKGETLDITTNGKTRSNECFLPARSRVWDAAEQYTGRRPTRVIVGDERIDVSDRQLVDKLGEGIDVFLNYSRLELWF